MRKKRPDRRIVKTVPPIQKIMSYIMKPILIPWICTTILLIVVNTPDKKFVCSMVPYEPYYSVIDDYKYLEPKLKEISEQY